MIFSTGCNRINKGQEDRDPNIKRARERRAVGDYDGALALYQKALNKRPEMARIHWEMASVYDQNLTNELRAIYHYQRYLEIDPKADRREFVESLIGAARMSYAASLPARPSEAIQEINRLKKENDDLRASLAQAQAEVSRLNAAARPGTAPAAGSTASSPAPSAAPPKTGTMDVYVVKPGDSLSRIASKVYGDPEKWNLIYDANRNILAKPESVKVGQSLVIPK